MYSPNLPNAPPAQLATLRKLTISMLLFSMFYTIPSDTLTIFLNTKTCQIGQINCAKNKTRCRVESYLIDTHVQGFHRQATSSTDLELLFQPVSCFSNTA